MTPLHGTACAALLTAAVLLPVACASSGTSVAAAPARPLVLVHYMPWFQAPPVSGSYGWHWHMGFTDPYAKDEHGRSPIASHYYPLTGPYDSADPTLLDYQTSLMKLSGIDGVIVDWYGIGAALDYPQLQKNTEALFGAVKKAGLLFAICYEDQSVGKRVEAGEIAPESAVSAATADLTWAAAHWFSDPAYLSIAGRPVVQDFGPQYLTTEKQWKDVLGAITPRPHFVTLDRKLPAVSDGGFPWPPMWASGGKELSPAFLAQYLAQFYGKESSAPVRVATVFPGFHDFYHEAGVAPSYGFLDDRGGDTFAETLAAAVKEGPQVIQVATWNDYGEGTMIEPTIQKGFRDLVALQDFRRRLDPAFPFTATDLALPLADFTKIAADRAAAVTAQAQGAPTSRPPDAFAGAPNLALGRPVMASNHIYEFVAANAVDGDVRTYWEGAAQSYPDVLTVDLGEDHVLAALRIKLNLNRIWQERTQTFAVSAAADGQELTEVLPAADYQFDPATGNIVTVSLSVKARIVAITFTANDGSTGGQAGELEIFGK